MDFNDMLKWFFRIDNSYFRGVEMDGVNIRDAEHLITSRNK